MPILSVDKLEKKQSSSSSMVGGTFNYKKAETVVLRRWENETLIFGIKQVDKRKISTVKR